MNAEKAAMLIYLQSEFDKLKEENQKIMSKMIEISKEIAQLMDELTKEQQ